MTRLLNSLHGDSQPILGDDLLEQRACRRKVRVGLGQTLAREQLVEVGIGGLRALADDQRDPALVDLGQVDRNQVRRSGGEHDTRHEQPEPRTQDADLPAQFHSAHPQRDRRGV